MWFIFMLFVLNKIQTFKEKIIKTNELNYLSNSVVILITIIINMM